MDHRRVQKTAVVLASGVSAPAGVPASVPTVQATLQQEYFEICRQQRFTI